VVGSMLRFAQIAEAHRFTLLDRRWRKKFPRFWDFFDVALKNGMKPGSGRRPRNDEMPGFRPLTISVNITKGEGIGTCRRARRAAIASLSSMARNGNAAFHGGDLVVTRAGVLLHVTRETPPWKAALPGCRPDTGA
jgi:hypothetical protein